MASKKKKKQQKKQTVIGWWFGGDEAFVDKVGVFVVEHDESIEDPAQALRDAAAEYLATPEGRDEEDGFNWGDLAFHAEIQKRAGVEVVKTFVADTLVEHDEVLRCEDDDQDGED